MKRVKQVTAPVSIELCGNKCNIHLKGRCDSDFPQNTYSLPFTARQTEMQMAARMQTGTLSVTETMLYRDMTHKRCDECRCVYEIERTTSKYCSPKCRKRASR